MGTLEQGVGGLIHKCIVQTSGEKYHKYYIWRRGPFALCQSGDCNSDGASANSSVHHRRQQSRRGRPQLGQVEMLFCVLHYRERYHK